MTSRTDGSASPLCPDCGGDGVTTGCPACPTLDDLDVCRLSWRELSARGPWPVVNLRSRPVLLDLFCCAGGMAMGYHRAGFEVIGVDVEPQPNYPFRFYRGDALGFLSDVLSMPPWAHPDAIHASPPCQAHSDLQKQSKIEYEDFVPRVRDMLVESGLPYVIENVEGAPLRDPVTLCGTMFPGLRVLRHRLFETNWPLAQPAHTSSHPLVFTHDKRKAHYGKLDQNTAFVQVTGGGNCSVANKADAMGIDWMTGRELNEAIPPVYAEYVGRQLRAHLLTRQAVAA